jgi:NAD(P)-dependent dehydrogenase (short-subunit alcohol dehydrogenase family)
MASELEEDNIQDNITLISYLESYDIYKLNITNTQDYNKIDKVLSLIESVKKSNNINKLTSFLKVYNTPEYLNLILNLVPYPLLIKWYYECNILKYYWNEQHINNIIYNNITNLKIDYLNKDFNNFKSNIIILNNQYNYYYNFLDKIIQKRLEYILNHINNLFEITLKIYNLKDISFGSDFVKLIGNKNYKELLKDDIIITLYLNNNLSFKQTTKYYYKFPYYYFKIDNITFKIFNHTKDNNLILGNKIDNAILDIKTKEILCTADFYQKLDKYYDIDNLNLEELKVINAYNINIKSSDKYLVSNINILTCYVCKKYINSNLYVNNNIYIDIYDHLCFECAKINYINKNLKANLTGTTYLITGGRVKIGYATALKLLRMNAKVIITTRYPHFAMTNYQEEHDYNIWKDNLTIIECDFTKLPQIYAMLEMLSNYNFNGIINNACQTIKNSEEYYENLKKIETNLEDNVVQNSLGFLSNQIVLYNQKTNILSNTIYSDKIVKYTSKLEIGSFKDIKDKPHDNSWDKSIDNIKPEEIVEATLINQVVPTLIINKLKHKLVGPKFIINVTSFEGSFNYNKTDKHIHTNMCKAAINMMIRSLAEDPDKDLHVYAINPGYVSGVCPQKNKYAVSLEDGASRITYPIVKLFLGEIISRDIILMANYSKYDW